MVSSASAQIEASAYKIDSLLNVSNVTIYIAGGDNLKTTIIENGKRVVVPDYAKV
jgi:hypothetical protein